MFDLLQFLIERRGQMVTKEDLLDGVWGDRFVSESALTSRIKSARRAVGDDGTRQAVIRTVHGRGYEFVADVIEASAETAERAMRPDTGLVPSVLHHLPLPVHRLIGRDALLDRLDRELDVSRMLTIVGPAGVGKTSIGLELARRRAGGHADGVVLVELVTVRDGEGAMAAIATALDVSMRQHASIDEAIVDLLRRRNLLIVVDNCEHLVEPLADLFDRVLRSAPDVTVLATSREPLSIGGEHVHVVEPLDVPTTDQIDLDGVASSPSVALFVERARAADSRFELTAANARAVAEICRRLDGIPLALELAASRTQAIDVSEIARRLDERLRLLRAVRRGADPRHGTLVDAIGWSYDLLGADEQRLFSKLAVFASSFDLGSAESICDEDDVLDLLTRLSQRSMVAVRRPSSGGTRYEVLETMREFGRSRLDDTSHVTLFQAHARHFAALAADVETGLQTPGEAVAATLAAASFPDLRAAQRFATQIGDFDAALALITSIREYAMRSLRYEVFAWADAVAAALSDDAHPLHSTLTALRAYGSFVRGEFDRAVELAEWVCRHARSDDVDALGLAFRALGNVCYITGDNVRGHAACIGLIEAAESSGNPSRIAHAYYLSSIGAGSLGDEELARSRYEASFAAARLSGNPTDLASAWAAKGFAMRDDAQALDAFASADRLARSAGNRWMSAFARTEASGLRVSSGALEQGCEGLAETVDVWYRAGEWAQQWLTLSRCVIALERIGRPELAAEVFGAVDHHATVDGPPSNPSIRELTLATRGSLDGQLGVSRAAELADEGSRVPVTELVHRTRNALRGRPEV